MVNYCGLSLINVIKVIYVIRVYMKIITVKLPEQFLEAIDELVNTGRYSSRSEVIRAAIGDFIRKELWVSTEE
jgi:Arc/MetJ-type ribon-helix-helix transcriptional regulator